LTQLIFIPINLWNFSHFNKNDRKNTDFSPKKHEIYRIFSETLSKNNDFCRKYGSIKKEIDLY
jgi:hypothetical protein